MPGATTGHSNPPAIRQRWWLWAWLALLLTSAEQAAAEAKLDVEGLLSGHEVTATVALPGEAVELTTFGDDTASVFSPSVTIDGLGAEQWRLNAPQQPGVYPVHVATADGVVKSLQLFVARPFHQTEELNGYRIGRYLVASGAPQPARYQVPEGFIEVHKHMLDTPVSSHFTLGQFLCKQAAGWPRYVALERSLLLMLENVVTLLQREGIAAQTLTILSGYRTPWYNTSIGNVGYSRHLYGDAADVYVDSDGDKFMDDLNADGVVSVADAQLLAKLIATLPGASTSGIGVYAATASHGPFVHIDTRGYAARW